MDTLNTDKNIIRFADGDIVYIEDVKYSHNGITHWEDTFNPNEHISTLDGVTQLGPHRYKKVKHSGDTDYQLPMKIIPDEVIFSKDENKIYWKYEYSDQWNELIDLANLEGPKGEKGDSGKEGQGLQVDYIGYYYDMPYLSPNSNEKTFLSVGDGAYKITSTDISNGNVSLGGSTYTHYSNDTTNWVSISAALANQEVQYLAEDNSGLNAINLKNTDYQGSSGTVYVFVDNVWSPLSSLSVRNPTVKLNSGAVTGKYLEDFIDGTYININSDEYFTITDNAIDPSKVSLSTFAGNGVQVDGTQFAVQPNDIVTTYTGITYDGTKLYVNANDLSGYGLETVDGTDYTNKLLYIDPNVIIGAGLMTSQNPNNSSYDVLQLRLGEGLGFVDGTPTNKVKPTVDGATITINNNSNLQVSAINENHIDSSIAGNGLNKPTDDPIDINVDNSTITINSNNNLEVVDYGIGYAQIAKNSIQADNFDYLGAGYFYVGQGDGTNVSTTAITGDVTIDKTGAATVSGKDIAQWNADRLRGVTIDGSADTDNQYLSFNSSSGLLEWVTLTDNSISVIDDLGDVNATPTSADKIIRTNTDGTFVLDDSNNHEHAVADITDIDGTYVKLDNFYPDSGSGARVDNTNGIVLKSSGGNKFQLIVDDNGNLDTSAIT